MASVTTAAAHRPRAYLRVAGPDAADLLERLLSNDVDALAPGDACDALLLTAKARVIAPVTVLRRGAEDFLVLTEPTLGESLRGHLARMRLRAHCDVEPEQHVSTIVFAGEGGTPAAQYGAGAVELLDADVTPTLAEDELELRRIEAGAPAWGKEIDDRILPAEAGLDRTHVSFTKGCYPGQEPVARLHHRGHPNRTLRRLELDGGEVPAYDAELSYDGKVVGRVTSAVRRPNGTVAALGYVRSEVPADVGLALAGGTPVLQRPVGPLEKMA